MGTVTMGDVASVITGFPVHDPRRTTVGRSSCASRDTPVTDLPVAQLRRRRLSIRTADCL